MSTAPQLKTSTRYPRLVGSDRVRIGYALVDNCSFEEAVEAILRHTSAGNRPAYVVTPNAQHVVLLEKDERLQEIYENADLVVADGISLVLASRLFGQRIVERVTGVDLFLALCESAEERQISVFLLGGRPGSAELAASRLRRSRPTLKISTYCPPMGFEQDATELERVAKAIRDARPSALFVALGAPKQEYWIHEHGLKLGVNVCIGIGGSLEMVGGIISRAPTWVQRIGFEWLYRLGQEPRRMWKRYLIGSIQFASVISNQLFDTLVSNWSSPPK